MEIKNSTFIVTGGSSGLGAATVEMVVAAGGNAIVADVSKPQGEALAAKLGKHARYVECDVTREDHGKAVVAAALKEFGSLHALVNCAGIAIGEKTVGKEGPHSLEKFAKVININLVGSFNMIRLAAEAMSLIDGDAAFIPLIYRNVTWAMRGNVKVNLAPNDILDLRFVNVE